LPKIEKYEHHCIELCETFNTIENKRKNYALHLDENSKIVKNLREHNISSIQEFLNEIKKYENTIRTELVSYDEKLKVIIEQSEHHKKTIESLQG